MNQESFPLRLFAKGNAKHWNPGGHRFHAGRRGLRRDDRRGAAVHHHLHQYIECNDPYMQIFTRGVPASLYALEQDSSPHNQIRASVTYNHVIERALALTGYYGWQKVCTSRGIVSGVQRIIKHIGDDERRHMAWGNFTCRRHGAANDNLWQVVHERMGELMGLVTETVIVGNRLFEQQAAVRDRPRRDNRLRRRQAHPPARSDRISPGRRPADDRPGRFTGGARRNSTRRTSCS